MAVSAKTLEVTGDVLANIIQFRPPVQWVLANVSTCCESHQLKEVPFLSVYGYKATSLDCLWNPA